MRLADWLEILRRRSRPKNHRRARNPRWDRLEALEDRTLLAATSVVSLSVSPSTLAEDGGESIVTATLNEISSYDIKVTLSFSGRHERLVVPFQSVISFADPSVKFGLQFEAMGKGEDIAEASDLQPHGEAERTPESAPGKMPVPAKPPGLPVAATSASQAEPKSPERPGGQVVALDAFRKK
jgi:hypothetical protein